MPIQRVTDFRTAEFTFTQEQWFYLPAAVKARIQSCGKEYPQGFGKPVLVVVPIYVVAELEAMMEQAQGGVRA